jgi:hypothetical protein
MGMKQFLYQHQNIPPVLVAWYRVIHQLVVRLLLDLCGRTAWCRRRPHVLVWAGVVISLVCQGVMLWILAQMVELCILLMEVWAELAAKHLEITLDETT